MKLQGPVLVGTDFSWQTSESCRCVGGSLRGEREQREWCIGWHTSAPVHDEFLGS